MISAVVIPNLLIDTLRTGIGCICTGFARGHLASCTHLQPCRSTLQSVAAGIAFNAIY